MAQSGEPWRTIIAILIAVMALAAPGGLLAQHYPNKPIRFIVPTAAGGTQDNLSRIVANKLTEQMKQQVIVDTRSGGSGIIGVEIAAAAAPDGYTLLLATSTAFATLPVLKTRLPYNPDTDFIALTRIAWVANVVAVHPGTGVASMGELVRLAKARPGQLNYGSAGNGTPAHLAGAMLNVLAGLNMVHVPYRGSATALSDLIAGQIQIFITSPTVARPHARTGRLKLLASTAAKRDPLLPELPAIAETIPGYDFVQWWGVAVPAGTPEVLVRRLHQEIYTALSTPEVRELMNKNGATPHPESPAEFAAFIKSDRSRIAHIAKQGRISLD